MYHLHYVKKRTEYKVLQVDNTGECIMQFVGLSQFFYLCKKILMPLSRIFFCCIYQLTYNHTDDRGKFTAA